MNTRIRIIVVEDDVLIAEDIRDCLTNVDYSVEAVVHNKEDAIEALEIIRPDLALLDINLGNDYHGFEIASFINEHIFCPFLYLTSYSSKEIIEQAKQTRPMGYIVKPFSEADLFSAIEIGLYNFSEFIQPLNLNRNYINERLDHNSLTKTEFEILKEIYAGKTNQAMAESRHISTNTVKSHVKKIYGKLNTHTRAETIAKVRSLL